MDLDGPTFVLATSGMVMLAAMLKSAIVEERAL
jgi:hypothetical protein